MNNLSILLQHIKESTLSFKDYPLAFQQNDIFVADYFSYPRKAKEYKHIPDHLLKNFFFVYDSLTQNPDIYLLAQQYMSLEEQETCYEKLKTIYPSQQLKYAKDSLKNDLGHIMLVVQQEPNNYQYLSEQYRALPDIITEVFQYKHFLNEPNDSKLLEKLAKLIPEHTFDNQSLFHSIVEFHNVYLFAHLPNFYKEDKTLALKALSIRTDLFSFISPQLQNDKDFVQSALLGIRQKQKAIQAHPFPSQKESVKPTLRLNDSDILNEISLTMFDYDFCEKFSMSISLYYPKLKKSVRSLESVIWAAVSHPEYIRLYKKDNNSRAYQYDNQILNYFNVIPIEFIKKELKNYYHEHRREFNFGSDSDKKQLTHHLQDIVKTIAMHNKLKEDLNETEAPVAAKMKI